LVLQHLGVRRDSRKTQCHWEEGKPLLLKRKSKNGAGTMRRPHIEKEELTK